MLSPSPSPVMTQTSSVGVGQLEARRDRGRAAVDRVEPVRVHVVREAARAADAGDEHRVLRGRPEARQGALHGREDRVVAAARAPANLLIGSEVLAGVFLLGRVGTHIALRCRRSSIASMRPPMWKGCPVTLGKLTASTGTRREAASRAARC